MVDILIRNVDKDVARRLKEKATAKGASLSETAREALASFVKPSRKELIEECAAFAPCRPIPISTQPS